MVAGANDHPPCYCQLSGGKPPIFGRTQLHVELYPLSFDPFGVWYEGFGVQFDATVGLVKTSVPNSGVATSTIGGFEADSVYRWVWPQPFASFDSTLKMGYGKSSFPLVGAQFPGTGYNVLSAGLGLALGVTDWLDILVDGTYRYRVVGFGGTNVLGEEQRVSGNGYNVDIGARFNVWEGLELSALAYIDHISVPFVGPTTFRGTNLQYTNVTLTDNYYGALLSVGYRL